LLPLIILIFKKTCAQRSIWIYGSALPEACKEFSMKTGTSRTIITPENEFLKREPELFTMNLLMPVQFTEDWLVFKKHCSKLGVEFEDVLGDLIIQFNNGGVSYKGR
jgi:hypothetical protein